MRFLAMTLLLAAAWGISGCNHLGGESRAVDLPAGNGMGEGGSGGGAGGY